MQSFSSDCPVAKSCDRQLSFLPACTDKTPPQTLQLPQTRQPHCPFLAASTQHGDPINVLETTLHKRGACARSSNSDLACNEEEGPSPAAALPLPPFSTSAGEKEAPCLQIKPYIPVLFIQDWINSELLSIASDKLMLSNEADQADGHPFAAEIKFTSLFTLAAMTYFISFVYF